MRDLVKRLERLEQANHAVKTHTVICQFVDKDNDQPEVISLSGDVQNPHRDKVTRMPEESAEAFRQRAADYFASARSAWGALVLYADRAESAHA